jgi:hypothetical protein
LREGKSPEQLYLIGSLAIHISGWTGRHRIVPAKTIIVNNLQYGEVEGHNLEYKGLIGPITTEGIIFTEQFSYVTQF